MKRFKYMYRYCIVFLFIIGVSCHALAQNVSFIASPSADKIGINDPLQISFTFSSAVNARSIVAHDFGDFALRQGPFQQTEMSWNNGVQSSRVTFTYVVQARHTGPCTIPPATATDAAGHTYLSNAVTVQVVPGSLAPPGRQPRSRQADDDDVVNAMLRQMQQADQQIQQAQQMMNQQMQRMAQPQPQPTATATDDKELKKDLFVKILIDKSKIHVGEQVTATFKLYFREPVNILNISLMKLPQLMGFWTQYFLLPQQKVPAQETVDGKKYMVLTFEKAALFPQQTGTLSIDPFQVRCVLQKAGRRGYDIFGRLVQEMSPPIAVELASPSDKITVTALPDKNKPDDFGGAVGKFTIAAKLDKQEITTDDIATLTVNITGAGNIKLVEAPKFTLPNGISTYDPQITDTVTGHSTIVSGTKIITYAITPHTPGDYDIPPISFTYFDPKTSGYITEHTSPLKLRVKQGKNYTPVAVTNNTAGLKDIHDITKQPLAKWAATGKPLLLTAVYWSAYSLPLLAFIGIIGWKRRDEEQAKDTVLLRNRRANKIALQRLVTAKKLLTEESKTPFYEEVSKAIWLYLSDKMNIPLSALSRDTARDAMGQKKIPQHLQKNLEDVIWECETALYASGGSKQMAHTYEQAVKVISDLEDVFRA